MKNKKAFTLAEVLITLGIIGIVAALTLPALISNHKRKVHTARLKKFVSVFNQALTLSQYENGHISTWPLGTKYSYTYTRTFFDTYLAPYFKDLRVTKTEEFGQSSMIKVQFSDGTYMTMHSGECLHLRFDVDGPKGRNAEGYDMVAFYFCTYPATQAQYCGRSGKIFCSAANHALSTREQALSTCKSFPRACARLLELDNWEFRKDYPY